MNDRKMKEFLKIRIHPLEIFKKGLVELENSLIED